MSMRTGDGGRAFERAKGRALAFGERENNHGTRRRQLTDASSLLSGPAELSRCNWMGRPPSAGALS